MDRVWLLTNTCYGNWLPGDPRGFVGQVTDHRLNDDEKPRVRHNVPGTEYDSAMPGLHRESINKLKRPPVLLTQPQASVLLDQFLVTARFRNWQILAAAIMANHFPLVVGVLGNPDPGKILGDFKSWGTRTLSARFGPPPSQTWWTERGSKRKLPDGEAVKRAVEYVRWKQPNPLAVWPNEPKASVGGVSPTWIFGMVNNKSTSGLRPDARQNTTACLACRFRRQ